MLVEKRKSPRQRTFLRGLVLMRGSAASVACIVRDFSDAGARLRFKYPPSFDGALELHIPGEKKTVQCRVVWRDNCEIGVAFEQSVSFDPSPTDEELAARVARLEAEILALKQMLGALRRTGDDQEKVA